MLASNTDHHYYCTTFLLAQKHYHYYNVHPGVIRHPVPVILLCFALQRLVICLTLIP